MFQLLLIQPLRQDDDPGQKAPRQSAIVRDCCGGSHPGRKLRIHPYLSDYAARCGCSCDLDARSSPTPEVGLLEGMQPLGGVPRALSEMVSFVSLGRI